MPTQRELSIIRAAARRHGIAPRTLYGLWGAESDFGENTGPSSAGAQGDFQFMPATARGMGVNPHNFRSAAFGAARYLSQYKDRGFAGMLAAYNAGPAGNPNNPETQAYIPEVRRLARQWPGARGGGQPEGDGGQPNPMQLMDAAGGRGLPGGSTGLLGLLEGLRGDEGASQAPSSQGVPLPSFAAGPAMPAGMQVPASSGPPAKRPDISGLIAAVRSEGGDVVRGGGGSVLPPALTPQPGGGMPASNEGGASAALQWAQSKVGFRESGGENRGGLADKLNARFGMTGQPWCAMFTSAAVTRGGAPAAARTASVAEVRRKAQEGEGYVRGFVSGGRARPGDLVLFGNDHIGMIQSVGRGGRIRYVGGNQSDGVTVGTTSADAVSIVRPQYGARRRRR